MYSSVIAWTEFQMSLCILPLFLQSVSEEIWIEGEVHKAWELEARRIPEDAVFSA